MSVNRLILLLIVLSALIILLVQNVSPAIPLVFLGIETQPLPLAVWIFLSISAGGLTSFLIAILFKLFKFTSYRTQQQSSYPPTGTASRVKTNNRKNPIPSSSSQRQPFRQNDDTTTNEFDDWETDINQADDWDFQAPPQTPKRKTYTSEPESQNVSRPESVYSYSSQEPKNTGVGKTESIYDADYRVIVPPYQPATTSESEDDWDFFADEDFEDDNQSPRR